MKQWELVVSEVDARCREDKIPMIGPVKARFLAEQIKKAAPKCVLECGTAIGYSGLWIAETLKHIGTGRLITVELDGSRSNDARKNFEKAEVDELIDLVVGDAREVVADITHSVDFLFLDNSWSNYFDSFQSVKSRLVDKAVIVADNVGIGSEEMSDYLDFVRGRYKCETFWFETEVAWAERDAMEVTQFRSDLRDSNG